MKVVNSHSLPIYEADPPFTRQNKILIDAMSCEAKNLSVGIGIYRRGEKAEMHQHAVEEVMYLLKGHGLMRLENGECCDLAEGIAAYVPPGEKHVIMNTADEDLEFLFVYSPAGPERGIRSWKIVSK